MKVHPKVAVPPARPLVIYDGDCAFCGRWVSYWQQLTGTRVEYRPYQDATVLKAFPEIPPTDLETAVHLVEPDGMVYRGAEAVLRIEAKSARGGRWLRWYEASSAFAWLAEKLYRLVARHRMFFSRLPWVGCRSCAKFSA